MAELSLPLIKQSSPFPNVENALTDPDGLLAFGGDLSVDRLVTAYRNGIFPWFSDGEPILWWSPSTRCIIALDEFHLSRSLRKILRKNVFEFSVNQAFAGVIRQCANTPRFQSGHQLSGTWITDDMINAYLEMHQYGLAHSIEVWQQGKLVGGLYGVVTDSVFCGESMFHSVTDASKAALSALVSLLKPYPNTFIDCQMATEHLMSLGAKSVNRQDFIKQMHQANTVKVPASLWQAREFTLCLE